MTTVKEEVLLRIDADIKGLVTKIAAGREELNNLKTKLSELKTEQEKLATAGKQGTDAFKDLTKEIILQEQAIKSSEKSIKSNQYALERQLTAQQEQEGSLAQLRAELSAANQAYDKLSIATRETSDEGKALKATIVDLDAKLKEQESQTGRNQRNVGNYGSALAGVKEKLEQLSNLRAEINKDGFENAQNTLDDISQGIANLTQQSQAAFDKIQSELIATGKSTIDQASSIRELTGLYKSYQDASLQATGEAKKAFQDLAADAKDKLGDVKQEIANLASDTSSFDAISQGVQTTVASFTLFQGIGAAFGKETGDIEQAIAKTTNAILILNSVTSIANALQKESSLVVKGTAAAQFIWNGALAVSAGILRFFGINVAVSSVALRGFTAALAATGIGAIVILLGLLISNFDKVVGAVKNAVSSVLSFRDSFGAFGKVLFPIITVIEALFVGLQKLGQLIGIVDSEEEARLKNNMKLLTEQKEKIQERYDFEIALARAAGLSTYKLEQDKLKAQSDSIKKQIENLFRLQQAGGKLNDEQQKQLEELKASWKKTFQDILLNQTQYETDQIKQANDASIALLNIELRKQAALGIDTTGKRKEIAARERDAALADQKLTADQKAVIEENYQQAILEIDKEAADKRFKLDTSVQKAQADLLRDGREKEIALERIALQEKLNSIKGFTDQENKLRELARQRSAKKIEEINKKAAEDEVAKMIEAAQNKINLESRLAEQQDNLAVISAKTRAEKLAAALQVINSQTNSALAQAELDKQKELNDQDKRSSESLDRLRASGEFKRLTISEQQDAENKIIEEGLNQREQIQQTYDAKELAILKDHSNETVQTYRDAKLEILNADLEFNQLKQDGNIAGFDADIALQIEQLNLQEQIEIDSKERTEQELTLIHNKYEKLRKRVTDESEDSKLARISENLGKTSEIFAKNTAAYKALAISQNYIDTYRAATAALAPPPTGAGPLFGPILAGATIIQGTHNAQKILSFKQGGYTGGSDPNRATTSLGEKPYEYHEQEYVINAPTLKDPVVSSFVKSVIHPKTLGNRPSISSNPNSFAGGGYAPNGKAPVFISQGPSASELKVAVSEALKDMPQIITYVEDINRGQSKFSKIESRGII